MYISAMNDLRLNLDFEVQGLWLELTWLETRVDWLFFLFLALFIKKPLFILNWGLRSDCMTSAWKSQDFCEKRSQVYEFERCVSLLSFWSEGEQYLTVVFQAVRMHSPCFKWSIWMISVWKSQDLSVVGKEVRSAAELRSFLVILAC